MAWELERWDLGCDGFCVLPGAIDGERIDALIKVFSEGAFRDSGGVMVRSGRGHAVAARNLIDSIPLVKTVWRSERLLTFLLQELGEEYGLVRALFFDKPPDRTWGLAWHKDTAIAVEDNSLPSHRLTRPTIKAGVPHVIASDDILGRMLTLRIHLDPVTAENGPLDVVPGSHVSSEATGVGTGAAVAIHADPGDVLAMRPLITHASAASHKGTRRHRRILHLEFAPDRILPDAFCWHRFVPARDD